MTRDEVAGLIVDIIDYYPNWLKQDIGTEALEHMATSWHRVLENKETEHVYKNLYEHVKTEKFAPALSDLTRHVWRELP